MNKKCCNWGAPFLFVLAGVGTAVWGKVLYQNPLNGLHWCWFLISLIGLFIWGKAMHHTWTSERQTPCLWGSPLAFVLAVAGLLVGMKLVYQDPLNGLHWFCLVAALVGIINWGKEIRDAIFRNEVKEVDG